MVFDAPSKKQRHLDFAQRGPFANCRHNEDSDGIIRATMRKKKLMYFLKLRKMSPPKNWNENLSSKGIMQRRFD